MEFAPKRAGIHAECGRIGSGCSRPSALALGDGVRARLSVFDEEVGWEGAAEGAAFVGEGGFFKVMRLPSGFVH